MFAYVLSYRNVCSAHLKEIFGSFGLLESIELDVDKRNGMSKGIAKVCFLSKKDAETAIIYMDGGQIDGSVVSIVDKISTISLDKNKSFSTVKGKVDGDVSGNVAKVNHKAEIKRETSNSVPLSDRSERMSNTNLNNNKYIPKDRSQIGDTGRNRSRSQAGRRDSEINHSNAARESVGINESSRYLRRDNRNEGEFRCARSRDRLNSSNNSNRSSHYGPSSAPARGTGGRIDNGIYGPGGPPMRRGYVPVVRDGSAPRRSRSRERGNRGQLSTRSRDINDRDFVHRRTRNGSPIRSYSRGRTRSVSRSTSRVHRLHRRSRSFSRSSRSRSSSRSASNRRRRRYSRSSSSNSSVGARNTRRYSSSRSRSRSFRSSSSSRSPYRSRSHSYSPSRSRSASRSNT